jgi:hypothetical protein
MGVEKVISSLLPFINLEKEEAAKSSQGSFI